MHLIFLDSKGKHIHIVIKDVDRILIANDICLSIASLCKKDYKFNLDENRVDWIFFWMTYSHKNSQ